MVEICSCFCLNVSCVVVYTFCALQNLYQNTKRLQALNNDLFLEVRAAGDQLSGEKTCVFSLQSAGHCLLLACGQSLHLSLKRELFAQD